MIWDDSCITGTFEEGCRLIIQYISSKQIRCVCYVPENYNENIWREFKEKAEVRHYPVLDNGEPDWQSVKAQAKEEKPTLFWYRHPEEDGDIRSVREFCNNVGAFLVEDCSKLIVPEGMIGKKGDAVIWNLRTMGIAKCGAVIVSPEQKFDISAENNYSRALNELRKAVGNTDLIKLKERNYEWKKYREICRYVGRKCNVEDKNYNYNTVLRKYAPQIKRQENNEIRLNWTAGENEWREVLEEVEKSTLTQEWSYGEAKHTVEGWTVKRALVYRNDSRIGLVQVLMKYHVVVRINRGPLLLEEYRSPENIQQVLEEIKAKFGKRLYLFQTEMEYNPDNMNLLVQNGYTLLPGKMQESAWVDLRESEEAIRGKLKSRWRNQLVAAEKTGMTIQRNELSSGEVLKLYQNYMIQKSFQGIPLAMLKELLNGENGPLEIYSARTSTEELLAFNIAYVHGNAATYLIGWMNDAGRRDNANNYLLYHMMLMLKQEGIHWFDLGGIDDIHTEPIAKFKRGINGAEYELSPECRTI